MQAITIDEEVLKNLKNEAEKLERRTRGITNDLQPGTVKFWKGENGETFSLNYKHEWVFHNKNERCFLICRKEDILEHLLSEEISNQVMEKTYHHEIAKQMKWFRKFITLIN